MVAEVWRCLQQHNGHEGPLDLDVALAAVDRQIGGLLEEDDRRGLRSLEERLRRLAARCDVGGATFEEVAKLWINEAAPQTRSEPVTDQTKRYLNTRLLPRWGSTPIRQITAPDIVALRDDICAEIYRRHALRFRRAHGARYVDPRGRSFLGASLRLSQSSGRPGEDPLLGSLGFLSLVQAARKGYVSFPTAETASVEVEAAELALLLEGIDLTAARRRPRWQPRKT